MLKLIRADLFKSFHRMYLYIFMAVLAGMTIFLNGVLASAGQPLEASLASAPMLLVYPLFIICMFADIVMAEENKEHTLKNTISFGVTRTSLFLSKTISTVLVAVAVAVVALCFYFAGAFLLLHPQKNDIAELMANFGARLGVAFLIYIAAAVLAVLLAAVMKRNAMFTFSYFGILLIPTLILKLLNFINPFFGKLLSETMFMQSQIIASIPQAQLIGSVWNALIHLIVFLVLGILLFRHQEVN